MKGFKYIIINPDMETYYLGCTLYDAIIRTNKFYMDSVNRKLYYQGQPDTVSYSAELSTDETHAMMQDRAIQILRRDNWSLKKIIDL